MPGHLRQGWHEQKVDDVSQNDRYQRLDKIDEH